MSVLRIVPNLNTRSPGKVARFYQRLFGLETVMDMEWIVTLATDHPANPQISFASGGGSGTPVPDLSIEVDDLDAVHQRAISEKAEIVYPLTVEPWGVRRFYVKDPTGKVLNVLSHQKD